MYINLNNNPSTARLMTNNRIENINTNNILSKPNNLNKDMKNISKENTPLQKLVNKINIKTELSSKEDIKEKLHAMKKLNNTEKIESIEKAHKERMKEFEVLKSFFNYTKNVSINENIRYIDQAIKYENKSAEGKFVRIEGITVEKALADYINYGDRSSIFDDDTNEVISGITEKEVVQNFIDSAKDNVNFCGSVTKLLYTIHKDSLDKIIDKMENETGESIDTENLFCYNAKTLGIDDIDTNKMSHKEIISSLENAKKTLQNKISKINSISDKLDKYINEEIKSYNITSKYVKNELDYNTMKLELDFQIKSKLVESIFSDKEAQNDEKDKKLKNDFIKVI